MPTREKIRPVQSFPGVFRNLVAPGDQLSAAIKESTMNTNTSGKSCELTEQELDGVTGGVLFKYEATPTIHVLGLH
jgi:hypothetical protein